MGQTSCTRASIGSQVQLSSPRLSPGKVIIKTKSKQYFLSTFNSCTVRYFLTFMSILIHFLFVKVLATDADASVAGTISYAVESSITGEAAGTKLLF